MKVCAQLWIFCRLQNHEDKSLVTCTNVSNFIFNFCVATWKVRWEKEIAKWAVLRDSHLPDMCALSTSSICLWTADTLQSQSQLATTVPAPCLASLWEGHLLPTAEWIKCPPDTRGMRSFFAMFSFSWKKALICGYNNLQKNVRT